MNLEIVLPTHEEKRCTNILNKFTPELTEKQLKALKKVIYSNGMPNTVRGRVKYFGVSNQTYYDWLANPVFMQALQQIEETRHTFSWLISNERLAVKAEEGDLAAYDRLTRLVKPQSRSNTVNIDKAQFNYRTETGA